MADAATAEVLFGPVDLPGDTAVILMAFVSVDAFGSAAGDTIGISVEAFPTLDTVSKTPAGPTRRWGPVALGESTDIAGFAGGGEFINPAGFAGGVFGASTSMTVGDPTELFTGGAFTGGLLTGAEGARGFSSGLSSIGHWLLFWWWCGWRWKWSWNWWRWRWRHG
eukprot:s1518_g24.t1